jgi:NADPH:quinone reductase-like Zn-dependent oxidoreductase
MKAIVPTGRPEALVAFADVDEPQLRPGEALIKVEAFSVNRGEMFQLEEARPGWRPGVDIAGTVIKVSGGGASTAIGQRVVGHPDTGGGWADLSKVVAFHESEAHRVAALQGVDLFSRS